MGHYRTLTGQEKAEALTKTHLDIIVAGSPKGEYSFRTAHGPQKSYLVIVCPEGSSSLWELSGSRSDRENLSQTVYSALQKQWQNPA